MAFTKQPEFTKKTTDLPDVPSPTYTATQIKDYIQNPSDELMATLNAIVDKLNATAQGASGADNIGATDWDGVTTSTVGALLSWLKSNKTDLTGDHKGTWQGYTPSKADPGISSVVEQHTSQLAENGTNIGDLLKRSGTYSILETGAVFDYDESTKTGTDSGQAIQDAIDYAVANGIGAVIIPYGKCMSDINITVPIDKVSIWSFGGEIHFPNLPTGSALKVVTDMAYGGSNGNLVQQLNRKHFLQGFRLVGNNVVGVVGLDLSSDNGTDYTSEFDTVRVPVDQFDTCLKLGSHSWCNNFFGCSFRSPSGIAIHQVAGASDFGERPTFIGCTVYRSKVGIQVEDGELFFIGGSIDHNDRQIYSLTGGRVYVDDSHLESNLDTDYWLYNSGQSLIRIRNSKFNITSDRLNYMIGHCESGSHYGGIEIKDCDYAIMGGKNYAFNQFFDGSGRITVDNFTTFVSTPIIPMSEMINILSDGGFERGLTEWTLSGANVPTSDASTYHSGTQSVKLSTPSSTNGDSKMTLDFDVKPMNRLLYSFYLKSGGIATAGGSLNVTINFYDRGNNKLFSYGANVINTDVLNWTLYTPNMGSNDLLVPKGAIKGEIVIQALPKSTTGYFNIDDVIINVI